MLWLLLLLLANPLARDRWSTLKANYTDNQKRTTFATVAEAMLDVHSYGTKKENLEEILRFTYGGKPNDTVIDSEEAEILASLLKEHFSSQADWIPTIDLIIQNGKSDNMDEIAKIVYRMNLSADQESDGYLLAKSLTQLNNTDDTDSDVLLDVYDTLLKYKDRSDYQRILAKLAIKLMSGRKIDTIASSLHADRESIQGVLSPLTK